MAAASISASPYSCFGRKKMRAAAVWVVVAGAVPHPRLAYFLHGGWIAAHGIREDDRLPLMDPVIYTPLSVVGFVLLLYFRKFFVQPQVAWAILNSACSSAAGP